MDTRHEVVLIGPMGAGKSTLAALLAARLGLPCVVADFLSGGYYRGLGYDEAWVRRTIGRDFRAVMAYRRPFEARLVEWLVAQHTGCVFDFGAGHVQHDDPVLADRVGRALAPFADVVLVVPSPDRGESIRVLRERRAPLVFDGFDLDAYAWDHPSYWRLATRTVYTAGRTPQECVHELVAQVDRPGAAPARTATHANALFAAGALAAERGDPAAARSHLGECVAIRRELGDEAGAAAAEAVSIPAHVVPPTYYQS
ncbi:MAG TPA: hypothetical protein VG370_12260, partial [Chloroflexota bacterium]|nr:hypothetical protein [Chloroflexota bacterium]